MSMELAAPMRKRTPVTTLTDPKILGPAAVDALKKLDPSAMIRNPVMFTVEVVAALTTVLFVRDLVSGQGGLGFSFQINLWLWLAIVGDLVLVQKRSRYAGLLIGLAAAVKLTPAIFILFLFAIPAWRPAVRAVVAFVGATALAVALAAVAATETAP